MPYHGAPITAALRHNTPHRRPATSTPAAGAARGLRLRAFRGRSSEIIEHVAGGGDALVLMPTGGGKSLCYQVPAIARHAGRGVALVVSRSSR